MPPPVYYPNTVVNFEIRFDEALHIVQTPDPVSNDEMVNNPPLGSPAPSTEPLITQRGDANVSFVLGRVPKKCAVELPGYRQAATFDMTIDFKEMPLDPRTLRAASVEIHMGSITAEQFAAGMRGKDASGRRDSILRTRHENGEVIKETLVMIGLVDEVETNYTSKGAEVNLKGRDFRGILIDSPLASFADDGTALSPEQILDKLQTDRPIDQVVQQIIGFHPMGARVTVQVNAQEWPDGIIPAPLAEDLVPRHMKGAKGKKKGGRATPPGNTAQMTYWDLIVNLCYLVGAIPYFQGRELRIRPTRSIYDQERAGFDPSIQTPFAGGRPRSVNGQQFAVRRLVYGDSIESLKFNRKFAGNAKPKVIRCVSVDTSVTQAGVKTVIEGRWPPKSNEKRIKAARTTQVSPGGQQSQEEIMNIPVPGIVDAKRLTTIAHNLFEEIGRNEMGGSCETNRLASLGGNNQDPDLIRLRPGDGVEFYVDVRSAAQRNPVIGTITDNSRVPFDEAVRQISDRIGQIDLARVIVATARGQIAELQRFFRVSNVHFDWENGNIKISFDFQNYLVQRFNFSRSESTLPGTITGATVPHRGT